MMLRLEMETINDAFVDNVAGETVRILRALADRMERDDVGAGDGGPLIDANGNTVGRWSVAE